MKKLFNHILISRRHLRWLPVLIFISLLVLTFKAYAQTGKPDLSGVSRDEREAIENACAGSKILHGPAAYYKCLREQLADLGKATTDLPIKPKIVTTPPARSVQPPTYSKTPGPSLPEKAAAEKWPSWQKGLAGNYPRAFPLKEIPPVELYEKIGSSVYLIMSAFSQERSMNLQDLVQGSAIATSTEHLITNCHILEKANIIMIAQGDKIAEAVIAKADHETDRCVLRVKDIKLRPIYGVRSFNSLKVGEKVYSLGNPSGLSQTFADGIISGLRDYKGLKLIQTTAPISPGSSGGGLFDVAGNLLGITTFLLKDSQALNFAIAADEFWR
jgi:S1-C subfamily serine protease